MKKLDYELTTNDEDLRITLGSIAVYFEKTAKGVDFEVDAEGYNERINNYASITKEELKTLIDTLTKLHDEIKG